MSRKKIKKTVAIATLGCKVNQYESASFQSGFEDLGLRLVPVKEDADVCVINTCAVTGKAGAQSRRLIRKVLREHPKARVVVTG
ncbi:MAG: tRNA (N(6)-L-threonylcarbamoyladenosine(37)-C(2))-methylthiotransferase MtaB, partial [Desulfobulbaceae bacterium]|nr:tRNA (N(6)-L-threonylcarbamoyladenosine(37)-C(2))-methylthiotransferase MtaB [Desulfobulbaceae bacterium]